MRSVIDGRKATATCQQRLNSEIVSNKSTAGFHASQQYGYGPGQIPIPTGKAIADCKVILSETGAETKGQPPQKLHIVNFGGFSRVGRAVAPHLVAPGRETL
ncbi:hypothetical protein [Roseibium aestuarii]|uniref:Uncharacterized protein n=1 Tax=Roseibium aestuarii TaxID=2600299 RepID=A0ABW4JRV0_9HYPH|nr:hypothetical protein [Roseibium aestuarii]